MLLDDAVKARTEILILDWREDARIEDNGVLEILWKREEDRGRAEQWRGRRGRNIFRSGGGSS